MDGSIDGWMDGQMDGWMDRWMDRQTDGQTDRRMDGRIDMYMYNYNLIESSCYIYNFTVSSAPLDGEQSLSDVKNMIHKLYTSLNVDVHQVWLSSLCPSIHLFTIHPFIHPFIYLSIHLSIHPFIYSSIILSFYPTNSFYYSYNSQTLS